VDGLKFILGAAAILSATGAGAPKPAAMQPEQMAKSYTLDIVQAAASSLGLQSEVGNDGDQRYAVVKLEHGAVLVAPANCQKSDPTLCYSVEMQAIYSQKNVPLSVINGYNDAQNFAQTYVHNGVVQLARSEFQRYGYPVGNFTEALRAFIQIASQFTQYLKESGQNASLTSPPSLPEKRPESALSSVNAGGLSQAMHLHIGVADKRYLDPKAAQ
jgi:hypothetical protein